MFGWSLVTTTLATATIVKNVAQRKPSFKNDNSNSNQQKFITLALIPHREQQRRRQRELNLLPDNHLLQRTDSYRRRRTSTTTAATQVIDALYQGYGTHYVDLWCGTPTPQRQTVIVDTGSGVTAFPCLGCNNCGDDGHHIDSLFNQSASTSFRSLSCQQCQTGHCHTRHKECQLGMTYQEGSSWSAYEVMDTCYAGGPHDYPLDKSSSSSSSSSTKNSKALDDADPRLASSFSFPMTFGCQTHLTGLFQTQLADGILGMDNAKTAFWFQMYQAGTIAQKMFSLCYSRPPTADRQGTHAGAMTLGGSDPRLHTTPMVYSTLTPGDTGGWYSVHIRRVYLQQSSSVDSATTNTTTPTMESVMVVPLNVTETDWNRGNTIVDSGTTSTYLSSLSLAYWNRVWQDVTGRTYFDTSTPVHLTREEFNQLPTILFQFQGDENKNSQLLQHGTTAKAAVASLAVSLDPEHPFDVILAIPPSHYMEYDEANDLYLASIVIMDAQQHQGNVLGANAIMGHDVLFNVEHGLMGWAESHCDYAQLLQSAQITTTPVNNGNQNKPPLIYDSQQYWDVCETWICQGATVACLVCVLALGLCIGRSMGRVQARRREHQRNTLSELELSGNLSKTTTEGEFAQYRDDPSDMALTCHADTPDLM
jgi:hypothetical protein